MEITTKAEPGIVEAISNISDNLSVGAMAFQNSVPFLMGDVVGTCLFFFNHHKITGDSKSLNIANTMLDRIVDHRYTTHLKPTFCAGVSGIGWFIQHLEYRNFIDTDEDIFAALDGTVTGFMSRELEFGNYDFLHGAMGAFYYLMNKKNPDTVELEKILVALNLLKVPVADTHYWTFFGGLDFKLEPGKANFGLSHGIPAIVAILSKYYLMRRSELAMDLVKGAAKFLYEGRNRADACRALYPYMIEVTDPQEEESRLAWCYGDLGVAVAFWHAYRATENFLFRDEALRIMTHAASRRELLVNEIKDAGLCHGTAGIAQIFRKFYFLTGNELFKATADYWISCTIDLIAPRNGLVTGRSKWDNKNGYVESYSLLEGLSGVGLSLLSAISDEDLLWDEVLLIS